MPKSFPTAAATRGPFQLGDVDELARMINDGFVEIVRQAPRSFPRLRGAGFARFSRCGRARGGAGHQGAGRARRADIHHVSGKPIDLPEYAPFWKKTDELGKPVWIHPARGAELRLSPVREEVALRICWALAGRTRPAAPSRRPVMSKIIDNHPNLKLIVHHFGGIIPMLEGRLGPGWDVLGSRTSDEDYVSLRKSLKKRPLDYFKQDFYADTAVFGGVPATKCGLEFYPQDKVIFASDCPFDPEGGTLYPRLTLADPRTCSTCRRRSARRWITRTSKGSPA